MALHVMPLYPVGTVATKVGTILAGSKQFAVTITGRGGHAAMPHLNIDPVLATAHVITAIQVCMHWLPAQPAPVLPCNWHPAIGRQDRGK